MLTIKTFTTWTREAALVLALAFVFSFTGLQFYYPGMVANADGYGDSPSGFSITSWNVRGYPEKDAYNRAWFTAQLMAMGSEVLVIQEIANDSRVRTFTTTQPGYTRAAFADSSDGMDKAIFVSNAVTLEDIALEPTDFQHPAQAALISYGGFDAVILTVHLTWTNLEWREREKASLQAWVPQYLAIDPDLIIVGDFNTKERGIQGLANAIGMIVMVPEGQTGVGTTHAGNRYDHFLISPDLASEEAVSAGIVTFTGSDLVAAKKVSDHLPVTAWFRTDAHFHDGSLDSVSTDAASPVARQARPPPIRTTPQRKVTQPYVAPRSTTGAFEVALFATNTDTKYHRDECQYLRRSKIPVTLQQAQDRGLGPCSKCGPPR